MSSMGGTPRHTQAGQHLVDASLPGVGSSGRGGGVLCVYVPACAGCEMGTLIAPEGRPSPSHHPCSGNRGGLFRSRPPVTSSFAGHQTFVATAEEGSNAHPNPPAPNTGKAMTLSPLRVVCLSSLLQGPADHCCIAACLPACCCWLASAVPLKCAHAQRPPPLPCVSHPALPAAP